MKTKKQLNMRFRSTRFQEDTGSSHQKIPIPYLVCSLQGDGAVVTAIAISPDGTTVVTGVRDDSALRIWDVSRGKQVCQLEGHDKPIRKLAFSNDGRTVVSVSWDGAIQLWDVKSWTPLRTLKRDRISNLLNTWACNREYDRERRIEYRKNDSMVLAFSPHGDRVVSVRGSHRVRVWDAASGKLLSDGLAKSHSFRDIAFSPDNKLAIIFSGWYYFDLWDLTTGQWLLDFRYLDFSEIVKKDPIPFAKLFRPVIQTQFAGFSPKGSIFTVHSDQARKITMYLRLHKWQGGELVPRKTLYIFAGQYYPDKCVHFSPDEEVVYVVSPDKKITFWDVNSMTKLLTLSGANFNDINFQPDGRVMARESLLSRGLVRILCLTTGEELYTFPASGLTLLSQDWSTAVNLNLKGILDVWGSPMSTRMAESLPPLQPVKTSGIAAVESMKESIAYEYGVA